MDTPSLMLVEPPRDSPMDRYSEMLDFLYQLVNSRKPTQSTAASPSIDRVTPTDLFEDLDDGLPSFEKQLLTT